jgi:hypothetical protein
MNKSSIAVADKFFGKFTSSKFSPEQVALIKKMRKEQKKSHRELGKIFNCAASTIGRVINPEVYDKNREYEKRPEVREKRRLYKLKNREKVKKRQIDYLNTERGFLVSKFNDCRKRSYRDQDKRKSVDFHVTIEDFLQLWQDHKDKYGWKCYYTGLPITIGRSVAVKGSEKRNPTPPSLLSVDRFDSNIGYTKENIVFCRWDFNSRKGNIAVEDCIIILKKHMQRNPGALVT